MIIIKSNFKRISRARPAEIQNGSREDRRRYKCLYQSFAVEAWPSFDISAFSPLWMRRGQPLRAKRAGVARRLN